MNFVDYLLWFIFAWVAIVSIWAFIAILFDVLRDSSLGGGAKAAWLLFLALLPIAGAVAYLVVRGGSMAARETQRARDVEQANVDYVRSVTNTSPATGGSSATTEIERAQSLLNSGAITPAEFDSLKAGALA